MIVTLYKGQYYNGVGEVCDVKPGDVLRPRQFENEFVWTPQSAEPTFVTQLPKPIPFPTQNENGTNL